MSALDVIARKPGNRRPTILLLAGLVLVILTLLVVSRGSPPVSGQIYQGKTADQWFFGPTGHPGLESTVRAARTAFEGMGTNCVPFLLEKAKTRERLFNRLYCLAYPHLPSRFRAKLKPAITATYVQNMAYSHLRELGLKPIFMADDILASVKLIQDPATRVNAFSSTEALAECLPDVEKQKAYFLSCLNDPEFQIQLESAVKLAHVDFKLTNGIPILLMAATNRNFLAHSITSSWPASTAPFLIRYLGRVVQSHQESARDALWLVSPKQARALPSIE